MRREGEHIELTDRTRGHSPPIRLLHCNVIKRIMIQSNVIQTEQYDSAQCDTEQYVTAHYDKEQCDIEQYDSAHYDVPFYARVNNAATLYSVYSAA